MTLPETRYDSIVIAAGQAGGPLSTALARAGQRTALIEREHVGGTCINVGARPGQPPLPGLEFVPALDSTSIMELDQVPRHLLVLGGGYVGLEFGQMFRRFGSQVTIVQRGARLLAREDSDVAEAVANILRQDGIEVLLETTPQHAEQAGDG